MELLSAIALSDWILAGVLILGIVALIIFSEIIHSKFNFNKEHIRKIVHIATGIVVLLTPLLFESQIPIILIATMFTGINYYAIKKKRLRSYNETERSSLGTLFYPVATVVLLWVFWGEQIELFYIPFGLLAFSDAVAGIVGVKYGPKKLDLPWDSKSASGALAMFSTSLVVILVGILLFDTHYPYSIWIILCVSIAIAAVSTSAELLSNRGSDNLSIPFFSAISLLVAQQENLVLQFIVGVALASFVAWGAYKLKSLNLSGAHATFILGSLIFGIGGWLYSIPILAFFVLSSIFSHLPVGKNQATIADVVENGARRNVMQVIANGLFPAICVVLMIWFDLPILFLLYLVSVASATSDTWATEIGIYFGAAPRSIINGKKILPGMSGGITMMGMIGAILGASTIALIGWLTMIFLTDLTLPAYSFLLVAIGGFGGQIVDSLLGATLQRKNRCKTCKKLTEREEHCGMPTELELGLTWMNNDIVNIICSFSGIVIFGLCYEMNWV